MSPELGHKKDAIVHRYDDIEEEDNYMPRWWLGILFATIVFGFGYWFVYHTLHQLPDPLTEYRDEVTELKKARAAQNPISDEAILELAKDPAQVEEGHKVYLSTCVACHAQEGQGLVGPNLTDKYWIHGHKPTDIYKSVADGFADKGMPPWIQVLGSDKIRKVSAYVLTLEGKNLPGKAPQGELCE